MGPSNEIWRMMEQIKKHQPQINQAWALHDNSVARQWDQIRADIESTLTPVWSRMSGLAETAERIIREARPPNWPNDFELDFHKLGHISESDGIPIFYVPRADIAMGLLEASDRQERYLILDERCADIAQDCLNVLDTELAEEVQDRGSLSRMAAEAFASGHYEAAQALAVVVCDSHLKKHLQVNYERMKKKLALDKSEEVAIWPTLRFFLPMATAVPFLSEWQPNRDGPAPDRLSRHATIHGADLRQINRLHATVAIMLATTMTLALNAGICRYGSVEEAFRCFVEDER